MRKLRELCLSLLLLTFWATTGQTQSNLAAVSEDYERFGLQSGNTPEVWEDGMRTTGGKDTYEWWYFDATLEDDSKAVIIFYTKEFTNIKKKLSPVIRMDLVKKDGTAISKVFEFEAADFSASKEICDVTMGKNYFRGNLAQYEIHLEDEDFSLTAKLQRRAESWRPKTGHILFGKEQSQQFNWVVPVPLGEVKLVYTHQGTTTETKGRGYHDHNWGNASITELFNHWYWARATIGPYNLIASEMIAAKNFEYDNVIVFNLSKDGKTMADNGEQVTFYRTLGRMHPTLKKDISEDLVFIYNNPTDEYRYEYYLYKEGTLLESDLLETAVGGKGFKYALARLITGFDGAYFRFTGRAEIRVYKGDQLVEKHQSDNAIWELMYLGKPLSRGK